ncbi:MAG: acetyl-CoA carboxylase carboxyltransferase subunit alpha [Fibrobacteria bacterium]|nr:acetyl-CoA carboxylase carboxyltransferase subunit alpha [Fibrobacteria bacterium]
MTVQSKLPKVPKGPYLDFEQPVIELAHRIEDLMRNSNITSSDVKELISKKKKLQKKVHSKLTPWHRIELARRAGRPYTLDYATNIFSDFVEIHGDRRYADDPAMITGLAKLDNQSVVLVGTQKGKDTQESIKRNFGMANPEGYRKAARAFRLAEKFNIPVVSLIDTPGAYPGIGAEERGQAQSIAENLKIMATLKVPVVVVITGEGASGGALGIGVGDRILMLENSWYCVITPEACSAILWGDNSKKQEVCGVMKLTPDALKKLGIIDKIIPEPLGGAHWDPDLMYSTLKSALVQEISQLKKVSTDELIEQRISKFSSIGALS